MRGVGGLSTEALITDDDYSITGDTMPQVYIKTKTFERILELGHISSEDCNKFIDDAVWEKVKQETARRKEAANHIEELITDD